MQTASNLKPKISVLAKLLFQILQCMHHLSVTDSPEGSFPKAFRKKQVELNRFLRPAQEYPDSAFRDTFQNLISSFLTNTLKALTQHYLARLTVLEKQVMQMDISSAEFNDCVKIALRWGNNTFGSKLSKQTLKHFQDKTKTLNSELQKHKNYPISKCTNPGGPPSFPFSDTPSPNSTGLSFYFSDPLAQPSPVSPPSCIQSKPVSLSPHAPSVKLFPHHPVSPKSPSQSTCTPPKTPPSLSTCAPPKTPPSLSTCTSSKTPPSLSTCTTPKTLPSSPSSTNPSPSSPLTPRNVQGAGDPLSNFYPCSLNFRGDSFRSAEHAYQFTKARFVGREDVAMEIWHTSHAAGAKSVSKKISNQNDPLFRKWEMVKRDQMREILWAKARQCDLFRSELLKTQKCRLTHNLPDRFWGSTYVSNAGKTFKGQDVFAKLLMEIRVNIQHKASHKFDHPSVNAKPINVIDKDVSHSPQPSTSASSRPPLLPSPSQLSDLATPSRFSVLQSEDFPPLPSPTSAPVTPLSHPGSVPVTPRTLRGSDRRRSRPLQPRMASGLQIRHHGRDKSEWQVPNIQSKIALIGDSNLARVTKLNDPVNSAEIHSFPGAKFIHLTSLFSEAPKPQENPTHVILSIGINSRTNQSKTHSNQLKQLISSASKLFPNALIYIPQINYSPSLSAKERASLDSLNKLVLEMAGDTELENFGTIPVLPNALFDIDPEDSWQIHWTNDTAKEMVSHWLEYLN